MVTQVTEIATGKKKNWELGFREKPCSQEKKVML